MNKLESPWLPGFQDLSVAIPVAPRTSSPYDCAEKMVTDYVLGHPGLDVSFRTMDGARKLLRACMKFAVNYLPKNEQTIMTVDRLITMCEPERTGDPTERRDPLGVIFWELATGIRKQACKGYKEGEVRTEGIPSRYRNNFDGLKPFETVNEDGSRGFLKGKVRDNTLEAWLDYCWYARGNEDACKDLARDIITYCGGMNDCERRKLYQL